MLHVFLLILAVDGVIAVGTDLKIKGGQKANESEFPWAASIQQERNKHYTMGIVCTPHYVISACNPFKYMNSSVKQLYVVAGRNEIKLSFVDRFKHKGEERVSTVWYTHRDCEKPPYSDGPWMYDYGLLFLQKPFTTKTTLQPIPQPPSGFHKWRQMKRSLSKNVTICTAVGWGSTVSTFENEFTEPSDWLLKVELKLISDFECVNILCQHFTEFCSMVYEEVTTEKGEQHEEEAEHPMLTYLFRQFVCAQAADGSESDICGGDFGGSLVCQGEVLAIHGWTRFCGAKRYPSVHYSLVYAWNWFESVIPGLMPIPAEPDPVTPAPGTSSETRALSLLIVVTLLGQL